MTTVTRTWEPYQEQVHVELERLHKRSLWVSGLLGSSFGGCIGVAIGSLAGGAPERVPPLVVAAAWIVIAIIWWATWLRSWARYTRMLNRARRRVARHEGFCWYCLMPGTHRTRTDCYEAMRAAS